MEIETTPQGASQSWPDAAGRTPPLARPGKIEVAAQAIARVAGGAAAQCYGVVGIASRRSGLVGVDLLPPAHYDRGVDVRFTHDHVFVEVNVVMEYGLRVSEIARNLIKEVKYAVESSLGLRVVEVNVSVQGLRVGTRDPGAS